MRRRQALSSFAFCLFLLASACAKEEIAHQQIERDANEIIYLLNQSTIEAQKVKDEASRDLRFNVVVSKDQATAALGVLQRYNLPKMRAADTAEMFREAGMIPTNEQQRARREVGIQGDIINALRVIPRVVDVQTAVNVPEDNPLRDPNEAKPRPKASVLLVYLEDNDGKPPLSVEDVQRFVQAKLPEIKSTEVAVNMFAAGLSGSLGGNGVGMPGSGGGGGSSAPTIDPVKGCLEKEKVITIQVCKGEKSKVQNMILGTIIVAGLLAAMVIFAVLRAMRYRKDLTRLTAQFEKVKSK